MPRHDRVSAVLVAILTCCSITAWAPAQPLGSLARPVRAMPTKAPHAEANGSLHLRVINGITGQLVPSFRVLTGYWYEGTKSWSLSEHVRGRDGLATLAPAVSRSGLLVQVRADDPALAPSLIEAVTPGLRGTSLTITLPAAARRVVRLIGPDGSSIAGASVRVHQLGRGPFALRPEERWGARSPWPRGGTQLGHLRSNAEGVIELHAAPGARLSLQIRHPEHLRRLVSNVAMDHARPPLDLSLERGAALEVRVRSPFFRRAFRGPVAPPSATMALGQEFTRTIQLVGLDSRGRPDLNQTTFALDHLGEGVFVARGLPPGPWQLIWQFAANLDGDMPLLTWIPIAPTLAGTSGTTVRYDLDLAAMVPGEVKVRARVNGESQRLFFGMWQGFSHTNLGPRRFEFHTRADKGGSSISCRLLPGTYRLMVNREPSSWSTIGPSRRMPILTTLPTKVTITPGGRQELVVEARVHENPVIRLKRSGDGSYLLEPPVFRRFDAEDPGSWLRPTPSFFFGPGPGLRHLTPHALAAGRHEIYIASKKDQTEKHDPAGYRPGSFSSFASFYGTPTPPRVEDLHFLGTIDVSRDHQVFEFEVPDELGW